MNKKQLYNSIMKNISVYVKKTINEAYENADINYDLFETTENQILELLNDKYDGEVKIKNKKIFITETEQYVSYLKINSDDTLSIYDINDEEIDIDQIKPDEWDGILNYLQ